MTRWLRDEPTPRREPCLLLVVQGCGSSCRRQEAGKARRGRFFTVSGRRVPSPRCPDLLSGRVWHQPPAGTEHVLKPACPFFPCCFHIRLFLIVNKKVRSLMTGTSGISSTVARGSEPVREQWWRRRRGDVAQRRLCAERFVEGDSSSPHDSALVCATALPS